jgi:hypothetical protein
MNARPVTYAAWQGACFVRCPFYWGRTSNTHIRLCIFSFTLRISEMVFLHYWLRHAVLVFLWFLRTIRLLCAAYLPCICVAERNARCKLGPNCPFQSSRTLKLLREASLERFWPIALGVNVWYRSCCWTQSVSCSRVLQTATTPLSVTDCWYCVILTFCGSTVRVLTGTVWFWHSVGSQFEYGLVLCNYDILWVHSSSTDWYCVILTFCGSTVRVLTGTVWFWRSVVSQFEYWLVLCDSDILWVHSSITDWYCVILTFCGFTVRVLTGTVWFWHSVGSQFEYWLVLTVMWIFIFLHWHQWCQPPPGPILPITLIYSGAVKGIEVRELRQKTRICVQVDDK